MIKIIAEAGINFNGSLNKALEMVRIAKECGASAVKFQYYIPETLCLSRNDFSSYDLLNKNRLRFQWLPALKKECDNLGIEFLVTPFCNFSAEDINPFVDSFKVAAPEVCDIEFLKMLTKFRKPLILSTGKVTQHQLDEIFEAIDVPITLLYCKSLYPSTPSDYDLNEIKRLKDRYKCPIGVSSHVPDVDFCVEAVKAGADMIETHFMLDNQCVDYQVSLLPNELKELCDKVKNYDTMRLSNY